MKKYTVNQPNNYKGSRRKGNPVFIKTKGY